MIAQKIWYFQFIPSQLLTLNQLHKSDSVVHYLNQFTKECSAS